jgi:hypothetical protein
MHNAGTEAHHAAFCMCVQVGGNGALHPGSDTDEVTLNPQPGNYMVMCYLSGADNVRHVAKGMLKELTVTPAASGATSALPQTAVNVTLRDSGFDTSGAVLPSGSTTWQVTNTGPQTHEFQVARLPAGGLGQEGVLKQVMSSR